MKSVEMNEAAVRPKIRYEIAPGIYRLNDWKLAIIDAKSKRALVVDQPMPPQRSAK